MRALSLLFVVGVLFVLSASCNTSNGAPCYPGDYIYCPCDSGVQGYSECPSDGGDYGTCNCSGIDPAVSDAAAVVCNASAGVLPLLCPCTMDSDCASAFCFDFPSKGPHCTLQCTAANAAEICPMGCTPKTMVCMIP
jgi:hypothetical protein